MQQNNLSRRGFLARSGKAALSMATLAGAAQLGAISQASAQTIDNSSDYKAMVCILLAGGADSFNMLVPTDNAGYAEYQTTRTDLALPQSSLLALSNGQNNGKTLGLHPQLTGVQSLYDQGKVAFLSNVGTLVEPTSTQALHNGSAKLPLGLYSHSDQISQWQTAVPDARSGSGWGGRIADLLGSQNANQRISMNISTAGSNEFQAGRLSDSYSVVAGESPTPVLYGYGAENGSMSQAIDQIYGSSFSHIFRRSYSKLFNDSRSANAEFSAALTSGQNLTTQFAADEFSQQMLTIAKTIAANQMLGMRRQTFFVDFGGWDHHDEVLNNMNQMLTALNAGLSSFQAAMGELGLENNVTTFTTSDFARTLSSNGRGSDHGWGGNAMIMGGGVKGGSIYGQYPSLALNNPLDTGRGVLMPTTSLDEYFAELALWYGVPGGFLKDVLPNVGRFYDVTGAAKPLGFMS